MSELITDMKNGEDRIRVVVTQRGAGETDRRWIEVKRSSKEGDNGWRIAAAFPESQARAVYEGLLVYLNDVEIADTGESNDIDT